MVGYMVRSVNFMSMGPLTHIIFCEVSSIIRNNAVWNTMTVDKAFCKSTDDSFRRSIVFREGRSISTVNVYFSKDQKLSLPWWKPFSIISLQPGHCLIPLGEWYHTGDSVLVSDVGRLGSQQLFSSARPWWAEVHVVEPMHNFIPATMASFFMILLGNVRRAGEGGWLLPTEQVILSNWLLTSSSLRSPFGEHSHGTQISSCIWPIQRGLLPL